MKPILKTDDIQFIEKYLKNSGVYFTDLRIEMVDHVASEIEHRIKEGDSRDFYYIFKDFMVEHKVSLIRESDWFYKVSDRRIVKKLWEKTVSLKGIGLLMMIFFSFRILGTYLEVEQLFPILKYAPFAIMMVGLVTYLLLTRLKKERYSSLERLGLYFSVVSQILLQFFNSRIKIENFSDNKLVWLEISSSLIIFVLMFLIMSAFELRKEYQRQFKIIT